MVGLGSGDEQDDGGGQGHPGGRTKENDSDDRVSVLRDDVQEAHFRSRSLSEKTTDSYWMRVRAVVSRERVKT